MSTIQIIVSVKPNTPPQIGLPLPSTGTYKFIEHDDIAQDDDGQRIRAPEVKPLYWVEYSPLTLEWQEFWFLTGLVHPYSGFQHMDINRLERWELDRLKAEWRSLTHGAKAFTNNHGTEEYRDYISERNLTKDLPSQGAITCAGNILKIMGSRVSKGYPVLTLNGMKPPPDPNLVNRITHPELFFCATNVPGYTSGGKEFPIIVESGKNAGRIKVDPFPNLDDIPTSKSVDTIVPLRSNGNKVAETFTENGIHFAINYANFTEKRIVNFEGRIVPTPYVQ